MPHLCSESTLGRGLALMLAMIAAGACERSAPAVHQDSVTSTTATSVQANQPESSESSWVSGAGPAILIEGSAATEAIIVGPREGQALVADITERLAGSSEVTLFGRGGQRSTAHLNPTPSGSDPGCLLWLLHDQSAEAASGWAIGFLTNQTRPVALDSVDVLSARDSMTLVAEVSRLASAVTATSDAAFQGLRFTAHDIRRFESSPGVQALVAHVIRRVNQEANPQEEQTLLIAERDSGATAGQYHLVYAERTMGLEEQVTTPEVIGAATISGRVTLVIARDNEHGIAYSLLERIGANQWRVRWTSKPTTCG